MNGRKTCMPDMFLARCLVEMTEIDRARDHLETNMRQSRGRNLPTLFSLVRMAMDQERKKEAVSMLGRMDGIIRSLRDGMPVHEQIRALIRKAELQYGLDKAQEAVLTLEQALELDPDSPRIKQALERLTPGQ